MKIWRISAFEFFLAVILLQRAHQVDLRVKLVRGKYLHFNSQFRTSGEGGNAGAQRDASL